MRYPSLKHFMWAVAAAALSFPATPAEAHGGEEREKGGDKPAAIQPAAAAFDPAAVNTINNRYLRDVKLIFRRACFDCHSEQNRFPSYYIIPGVRQVIDYHIRAGREHIDMNADFPFKGHSGNPLKDLQAVKKEIDEGDMPPLLYKVAHWKERLTRQEEEIIQRWATEGIKLLSAAPVEPAPPAAK